MLCLRVDARTLGMHARSAWSQHALRVLDIAVSYRDSQICSSD